MALSCRLVEGDQVSTAESGQGQRQAAGRGLRRAQALETAFTEVAPAILPHLSGCLMASGLRGHPQLAHRAWEPEQSLSSAPAWPRGEGAVDGVPGLPSTQGRPGVQRSSLSPGSPGSLGPGKPPCHPHQPSEGKDTWVASAGPHSGHAKSPA